MSKRFKERYEIQSQLSKKGERRTLLARDLQTQTLVVIKVLSFGNDFEWEDLKLFEREAQVLQSLSHPAIPRYLDHFEIETDTFIGFALVQTYIAAKSLDRHIEAGRTFSEAEIQQLAKDLLGILVYLHNCQPPVIHRDIKPSNILLTDRSAHSHTQVYLVDFGSVQTGIRKGRTITIAGTYGYMPPEQFGGRSQPASDLYSLGATLIHLATGQYPGDLPQTELKLEFESMVNLSPELVDWLRWMTEPSLNRRLSSAEQALDALEHPQLNRLVQKPAGSKVRLKKDRHILEIYIPPAFEGSVQFFLFFTPIFLALNSSIIHTFQTSKEFQALPWPIPLIYYVALVFSFFILNFVGVVYFIFPLFSGTTYRFNQQDISTEILSSRFPIGKMPKIKLSKLEYTPYALKRNGETSSSAFIDGPKITIWAGTKSYMLKPSAFLGLTEPDLEWLAYEISDWLKLPFVVTGERSQWPKRIQSRIIDSSRFIVEPTSAFKDTSQEFVEEPIFSGIQPPSNSRVLLAKGQDTLEVVIPPEKFGCGVLVLLLIYSFFCAISIAPVIYFLLLGGLLRIVCLILLVCLLAYFGFKKFIFHLVSSIRLFIAQDYIQVSYQILGCNFSSCSSLRKHIWKLEYTPKHKQATGDGTIDVPPQLMFWVGTRSYRLNSNYSSSSRLTDLEVNWLTSELSQWLDIPVDVT